MQRRCVRGSSSSNQESHPQPLQSTSEKTKEQHKHKTMENPHQKSWHNECHAVIEEDLKIALETMNL